MNILVCVKRVPVTGAKIVLSDDRQSINTRNLGFAVSPHEECAVEEAVRLVEQFGGTSTVLTLGPSDAHEQLRDAIAMGIDAGMLLETDGGDWDPQATADAIVEAVRAKEAGDQPFDLILFGNESADSGGFQVGIRVAHALDRPCVAGIKGLAIDAGVARARREAGGGFEVYEVPLPAVFTVKEGINLPRFRTMPGRLRARKAQLEQIAPQHHVGGLEMIALENPPEQGSKVEILGEGAGAVPNVVEVLQALELV